MTSCRCEIAVLCYHCIQNYTQELRYELQKEEQKEKETSCRAG